MSDIQPDLKQVEPRSLKQVEQEYANIAAQMGDMLFKGVLHMQKIAQEADSLRKQEVEQAKKAAEAMAKEAEAHTA